jgi:hypothetical protein
MLAAMILLLLGVEYHPTTRQVLNSDVFSLLFGLHYFELVVLSLVVGALVGGKEYLK